MTLTRVRLLQFLGLIIAFIGLIGFWMTKDVARTELATAQKELINLKPNTFSASFLVAGRDYDYVQAASPCVWKAGVCYRDRVGKARYGNRTDTMLYVQIIGDKVTMISFPRDIYLPHWVAKLNEMYFYKGPEGLKKEIEAITGLPIDYYAIVNIDIFKALVDALGGVEVTIPQYGDLNGMHYHDAAAGLDIDFDPGPRHLSGEDAAKFVRFRNTPRGDYDRIDNVKSLASAILKRVKELNVGTAFKAPELIDALFKNLETNATPVVIRQLLPYVSRLQLQPATLPTYMVEGTNNLAYDPAEVESFMAQTFGGQAREFVLLPKLNLLITNRSEVKGLAEVYRQRLIAMGLSQDTVFAREATLDPTPTRLLTTTQHWQNADYFTSLFQISKSQVDHIDLIEGEAMDLELVLGKDAATNTLTIQPLILQSQR
jgi:LCP family protein required for cell wall assembly